MNDLEKKSIYSILNLVDFLESMDFVNLDVLKVDKLRENLFSILNSKNEENNNVVKSKYDLLEIIPTFFSSKKIFKNKNELLNFLYEKLEIKYAKKWKNKTIADIVGNFFVFLIDNDEEYYKKVVDEINKLVLSIDDLNKPNKKNKNSKFMSMWFNFFENYRK